MKNEYFKTRIIAKAQIRNMSKRSKSAALDEAIIDIVPMEDLGEENEYIDNQPDLMMVESILVSTGMNGNDDVFLPSELMEIRNTGKHKPVNIEHDDNRVVGHIVESFPTTKEGERIEEEDINDPVKMPSSFDLTNRAVVYAYVFPNLAHEIREEASNNQLFVSVEVWYKGYDYLVGNSIVERNERTVGAFDPVLRMNGGTGYVNGMKVGKVLRDMLIAGVGLVANPANEESVIKSVSNSDKEISEAVSQDFIDKFRVEYFNSEETVMNKSKAGEEKVEASVVDEQSEEEATETLDEVQEVEAKVEESTETKAEAKAEEAKDDAQTEESDTENQSQEETVTETEAVEQKVEETEDVDQVDEATASEDSTEEEVSDNVEPTDEITRLTEALAEATAKIEKFEAEKLNERRISEVMEILSVDITKAEKLVAKSIDMDHDAFSSHLQDLLELFSKSVSEEGKEEEVKEEEVKDEKVEEPTEEIIEEPKEEVVEEPVVEEPVVIEPVIVEPVVVEPKEEIKEEVKEEIVVEDTAIEEAVDEALDNAEKEKEVVEFKENKEDDDLEAKFAEVVKKFIKQKEE